MENTFPCKDCLVKMVCKEECDKVIQSSRIINMYITLYRTCPDCGNNLNDYGFIKEPYAMCFKCNSAFNQSTIIKSNLDPIFYPPIVHMKVQRFTLSSTSVNIITDLKMKSAYTSRPKDPEPPTMEETHDVVFDRMNRAEAKYVIDKHHRNMRRNIMKKFPDPFKKKSKKLKKIEFPKWAKNVVVKTIGYTEMDEQSESPSIIK